MKSEKLLLNKQETLTSQISWTELDQVLGDKPSCQSFDLQLAGAEQL